VRAPSAWVRGGWHHIDFRGGGEPEMVAGRAMHIHDPRGCGTPVDCKGEDRAGCYGAVFMRAQVPRRRGVGTRDMNFGGASQEQW